LSVDLTLFIKRTHCQTKSDGITPHNVLLPIAKVRCNWRIISVRFLEQT
jgi:hypothetical protein